MVECHLLLEYLGEGLSLLCQGDGVGPQERAFLPITSLHQHQLGKHQSEGENKLMWYCHLVAALDLCEVQRIASLRSPFGKSWWEFPERVTILIDTDRPPLPVTKAAMWHMWNMPVAHADYALCFSKRLLARGVVGLTTHYCLSILEFTSTEGPHSAHSCTDGVRPRKFK